MLHRKQAPANGALKAISRSSKIRELASNSNVLRRGVWESCNAEGTAVAGKQSMGHCNVFKCQGGPLFVVSETRHTTDSSLLESASFPGVPVNAYS